MKIAIFSGAGLDAESGIQTFRDSDGLWEKHNVMDVCDITTFDKNYELVHKFYNQRRVQLADVKPNQAHYAIAELCKRYDVLNYTANVSDLLERAGVPNVRHIHGKLWEVVENFGSPDEKVLDIGYREWDGMKNLVSKPNVVFFGEMGHFYQEMWDDFYFLGEEDIAIVVGSTLEINPIHYDIEKSNARFILINPNANAQDGSELSMAASMADHVLDMPATEAFEGGYVDAIIEEHLKLR